MIYFDGKQWKKHKYKVSVTVTQYGDFLDGFPENSTREEVVLTPEQQERFDTIPLGMNEADAILYVRDGSGALPDTRTDAEKVMSLLTDEQISANIDALTPIADQWKENTFYTAGTILSYSGALYRVLQSHRSQADWAPDVAVSLFGKLLTGPTVQEWQQPDSTNPYMKGDRVLFNGKTYDSLIENNVWSPSDYPAGWKEV